MYLICLLANTMAMLLAWFFIFVSGSAVRAAGVAAAGAVSAKGARCWGAEGRRVQQLVAGGRLPHSALRSQLSRPLPTVALADMRLLPPAAAHALAAACLQDTIQKEKDILEQGYPDVSAMGGPGGASAPGLPGGVATGLPVSTAGDVALPQGSAVLLEDAGGNASHLYVDVIGGWVASLGASGPESGAAGGCSRLPHHKSVQRPPTLFPLSLFLSSAEADLDAPKTFQDKVDDREKLVLIRRFFYGVCFYREQGCSRLCWWLHADPAAVLPSLWLYIHLSTSPLPPGPPSPALLQWWPPSRCSSCPSLCPPWWTAPSWCFKML